MNKFIQAILILGLLINLTGCIHEYPVDGGADPSKIEAAVELTIDLKWGENETEALFGSRGRNDSGARMVIEISRAGELIGRDSFGVSESEIAEGEVYHKLSFNLHALNYDMAVWCEVTEPGSEDFYFNSSDLSFINFSGNELLQDGRRECGFVSENLDLRAYKGKWGVKVVKEAKLNHPGAKFKLVTTDMRRFVEEELDGIEKGETYTLTINYGVDTAHGFNAYTGEAVREYELRKTTGELIPTHTIFNEIEIANGYLFCGEEENITMSVSVHNSARVLVVKSPEFRFPVKRGMVSIVKGEFLSEKFTNNIKVDNVWEGEIIIDL